jgi:FkbM family methyltransferase
MLRRRLASRVRSIIERSVDLKPLEWRLQSLEDKLIRARDPAPSVAASVVDIRRINGETLVLGSSPFDSGLPEAVRRVEEDFYLTQTASFRQGDTAVDVGAHVGVLAIYLAKKYPFLTVLALEPDPVNFSQLVRNVELNQLKNVTAVNAGLSADGRRRTLYVDPRWRTWATLDAGIASSRGLLEAVEVDTLALKDLFQRHGIRNCRLLKITAPGAVGESLRAFTGAQCVDLLCGDVDLGDCPLPQLEVASWRIARQHFWRTTSAARPHGPVPAWIQQLPTKPEQLAPEISPVAATVQQVPLRVHELVDSTVDATSPSHAGGQEEAP